MKSKVITALPGPKSEIILKKLQQHNGAWDFPYPFVHSREGSGCYTKDLDGNIFLDWASQVASLPLGYNHPDILAAIKQYATKSPIKYAGQDFVVQEHVELLEELLSITPKELNAAFFVNSGAEAVENAMKICMRQRPQAKVGVSFESAFHGRTLGALSCTNSKIVHKKHFFSLPIKRLPFNDAAGEILQKITAHEAAPEEIAFIILEHIQGEGGYRVASKKMIKDIYARAQQLNIPIIADEVQSGIGRTGKWWAFEHFGVRPTVISAAKALQVGAAIANKNFFPKELGSISSTWGGGHILDLAIGAQTIRSIKKLKLLDNAAKQGEYLRTRLQELSKTCQQIENIRGLGLMCAFDCPTKNMRDNIIIGALQNGLILLGCGERGIRMVPPLIIKKEEIDEGVEILKKTLQTCSGKNFKHTGKICAFVDCGGNVT